jgi:hypothetical protein
MCPSKTFKLETQLVSACLCIYRYIKTVWMAIHCSILSHIPTKWYCAQISVIILYWKPEHLVQTQSNINTDDSNLSIYSAASGICESFLTDIHTNFDARLQGFIDFIPLSNIANYILSWSHIVVPLSSYQTAFFSTLNSTGHGWNSLETKLLLIKQMLLHTNFKGCLFTITNVI